MKLALIALVLAGVAGAAGGCRSWCHDQDSRYRDRTTAVQDPYRTSDTADSGSSWKTGHDTASNRDFSTRDLDATATIRRRIFDARLSQNARNANIVTQNGYVTLRGPVDSQTEKEAVARIAREVVGDGRVYDMTDVVQAR